MCDSTAHGDSVMSETRDMLHRARAQREGDCDTRGRISPPEDWPRTADLSYPVWHADVPSAPWLHREWATTHTETNLCGAVLVGSGSDRHFCLTRLPTRSILLFISCLRMSSMPLSTGASPCRANKPKLSVPPRSGPFWAIWSRPAIRRGIAS